MKLQKSFVDYETFHQHEGELMLTELSYFLGVNWSFNKQKKTEKSEKDSLAAKSQFYYIILELKSCLRSV